MHGYLPEAPSTDGIFFDRGSRLARELPDPFPVTEIYAAVAEATSPGAQSRRSTER